MAALEALVQEKLKQDKEEKNSKLANNPRLVADPNMSVTALQYAVKSYLVHKEMQDLWRCISPPPGTPNTYGWHSTPNGEWLCKASGLLFELLGVADSRKLIKALKCLHEQKDLVVHFNHHGKPSSLQDELDKYDFTIRVLMHMVRKLRASHQLKTNVCRSLCKRDVTTLQILLDKVVLPQEFILDEYARGEEDGWLTTVDTHPAPADLGIMVPEEPPNKKPKDAMGKNPKNALDLEEMPGIFGKILGRTMEVCEAEPKDSYQMVPFVQKKGSKNMDAVLEEALNYIPEAFQKLAPKEKAKAKAKANSKKKPQPKKKATKAKEGKGKKLTSEKQEKKDEKEVQQYQAGDYAAHREKFIKQLMEKSQCNWKQASHSWNGSVQRAALLQSMSVGELKRRRFIGKDEQENPFLKVIEKSQDLHKKDVD